MSGPGRLEARFRGVVEAFGGLRADDRLVVAVSGGLDSVVLLHLLRFGSGIEGPELHVAHLDHAMRPSSREDALWVRGLCRAWGLPLHSARAGEVPGSEQAARRARYAFLERVRHDVGARRVLTAHHADDQAETVLFRLLRGTGPAGVVGIRERREPALWRPLLGFWRSELEDYAREARISWREDPTNQDLGYARNVLRNLVLPEIERTVAPGARRALVGLADLAREEEAGWRSELPEIMDRLDLRVAEETVSLRRGALLRLHPAVRARVLRALAADAGIGLGQAATRRAVEFATSASSGRRLELGGTLVLRAELDRLVLGPDIDLPPDEPVRIPDPGPGEGSALLGGQRILVSWGGEGRGPSRTASEFDPAALRFPLWVRAREPGDRIRLEGGTKKVKRLFLERRIPPTERASVPLLVDA
ncbi:MAG TPA: tRNA lysidine(34) synthetase TilS, partial [Longimicrobiales bacterium]|nr:tRNA lysidine(34) synthetase TilS [Longimicrobiales bacterium]